MMLPISRLACRSTLFAPSRLCGVRSIGTAAAQFVASTPIPPPASAPFKVPLQLIQDVRARTGAGMSDCKKALETSRGEVSSACAWLREKGKATASKLSARVAGEGVLALAQNDSSGVLIELNSETDFVSRGPAFRTLANKIAGRSLKDFQIIPSNEINSMNLQQLGQMDVEVENDEPGLPPVFVPVDEAVTRTITKTKENIKLRKAYGVRLDSGKGVVSGYIHGGAGDNNTGRLGALVALESTAIDHSLLKTLANNLAMHIVAMTPTHVEPEQPGDDEALLEQKYFQGNGETVREMLVAAERKVDAAVRVHSFLRLGVGEGVEKKPETDFATEVMSMINKS